MDDVALTFRASTNAGDGSSNQRTITVPAGTANGDHLWLGFYVESGAAAPLALGGLVGWVEVLRITNTGTAPNFEFIVLRRIASGEPTEYIITWDGNFYWNGVGMAAFSGGDGTTQSDATPSSAISTAGSTSMTATSITTATNDAELIFYGGTFNSANTGTPPTGMTERIEFGIVYLAHGTQTTAGASGTKTSTRSAADPWAVILAASKPAAGGAGLSIPVAMATYRRRRV